MKLSKIFLVCFFLMCLTMSHAQNFQNLNFEQSCDTSKTGLCYWDLSWGNKINVTQDILYKEKCLLIKGITTKDVGFTEQSSEISALKEIAIITLSASVNSDSIEGKGAGLNLNIYDDEGQLLTFKDMGGFYSIDWITGTRSWKEYSISLVCPIGTAKIKIGAILYGKGKAWFDNLNVVITPVKDRKASKLAAKYILDACNTIEKYSLVRDSFDIDTNSLIAMKIAGNAKKYSDCYIAIEYLLQSLRKYGDHHSFFMKAHEVDTWKNAGTTNNKIEYPTCTIIDSCGYIKVPAFHGGNEKVMLAYADSLQSAIRKLDSSGIKG